MASKYIDSQLGYTTPTETAQITTTQFNTTFLGYLEQRYDPCADILKVLIKDIADPTGNGVVFAMGTDRPIFEFVAPKVGEHFTAMRHPEMAVYEMIMDTRVGVSNKISYTTYLGNIEGMKRAGGDASRLLAYTDQKEKAFARSMGIGLEIIVKGILLGTEAFLKLKNEPHIGQAKLYLEKADGKIEFSEQNKSLEKLCGCFKDEGGQLVFQGMCCACVGDKSNCKKWSAKINTLEKIISNLNKTLYKNRVECLDAVIDTKAAVTGDTSNKRFYALNGMIETILKIAGELKSNAFLAAKYLVGVEFDATQMEDGGELGTSAADSIWKAEIGPKITAPKISPKDIACRFGNYTPDELVLIMNGLDIDEYNTLVRSTQHPSLYQIPYKSGTDNGGLKDFFGIGTVITRDWYPRGQFLIIHKWTLNILDMRWGQGTADYPEAYTINKFSDLNFLIGLLPCYPAVSGYIKQDGKDTLFKDLKKKSP